MFTGLVESMGSVVELTPLPTSTRIGIRTNLPMDELEDGESIAVDGVCLTVIRRDEDRFFADIVRETLDRSTLGQVREGSIVNLERSLSLGDRLGGHLVQGHVDTTTSVTAIRHEADDYRMQLALPSSISGLIAEKGSVALHGVSLTVAAVHSDRFEVALVPQTLAGTTLGTAEVGQRLNVEVDLLARYLERLIQTRGEHG